jgi:hypothetical protein
MTERFVVKRDGIPVEVGVDEVVHGDVVPDPCESLPAGSGLKLGSKRRGDVLAALARRGFRLACLPGHYGDEDSGVRLELST